MRSKPIAVGFLLAALVVGVDSSRGRGQQTTNPCLGQPEALEEGERIYRSRCIGCHFRSGGRGPNIFQTRLTQDQFFDRVINGGKDGMPAWGAVLSTDEICKVHAFLMSRDRL